MVGRFAHVFPPDVAVVRLRHVREDAVAVEPAHRVRVRPLARPRRDAEEARLGVDRVELTVLAELHPTDVVADGLDPPAVEDGLHHREVRLAAGAREGGRDVLALAARRRQLEDQHVLGEPALLARHDRGDAQRIAFLA